LRSGQSSGTSKAQLSAGKQSTCRQSKVTCGSPERHAQAASSCQQVTTCSISCHTLDHIKQHNPHQRPPPGTTMAATLAADTGDCCSISSLRGSLKTVLLVSLNSAAMAKSIRSSIQSSALFLSRQACEALFWHSRVSFWELCSRQQQITSSHHTT